MNFVDSLRDKGYQVVQELRSESFGDFLVRLCKGDIEFKIISDRSVISIEVRNTQSKKWIDIKNICQLLNEKINNSDMNFKETNDQIIMSLDDIENLMSKKNYITTIERIA